jgi:hypothetical protein
MELLQEMLSIMRQRRALNGLNERGRPTHKEIKEPMPEEQKISPEVQNKLLIKKKVIMTKIYPDYSHFK